MAKELAEKYKIKWLAPDKLADQPLINSGTGKLRSPQGPYSGHVDPLYNIHCELDDTPFAELQARIDREGGHWDRYWRQLAESLLGKVRSFALVAYGNDLLAGHVRFFPSSIAHLRVPNENRHQNDGNVLLIGAGCVDLPGAEDGLDIDLVRRVVSYARCEGYAKVQAVAWSNIRVFAMWGEQFPLSTYQAAGFRKVAPLPPDKETFDCMLAGSHGPEVQKMAQAVLDKGMTKDEANAIWLVEIDTSKKETKTTKG